MTRVVAIVQARIGSTRLPGKVLYELAGRSVVGVVIERLNRAKSLDEVVLATSTLAKDDALANVVSQSDRPVFRGPEEDVLARYSGAAKATKADLIVRVTADCPLVDPDLVDEMVSHCLDNNYDYCTNVLPPSWPDGLDLSVFTQTTLETANQLAQLPSDREHVVPWMWRQSNLEGGTQLKAANLPCAHNLANERWTIDTPDDYLKQKAIAEMIGHEDYLSAKWREIMIFLNDHPEISTINAGTVRDEGLTTSLMQDAKRGKK